MSGDVDKLNDTLTNIRLDITEIKTMLSDVRSTKEDHEVRIRSLEKKVWVAAGVAALFAGGATEVLGRISGV